MAILNHAKDNRLGVWRPKQYETNGLRGRILVFRFLEPQSTTPRPPHPPPRGPFGNPLLAPSALFFSVIFPAAHLSLLNETGEADGALLFFFGRSSLPFFLVLFSSPFLACSLCFFFVTGRRMQKREGSSRANLETGSPAAPPRAITLPHGISPFVRRWRWWLVPLCPTVLRCTDTPVSSPLVRSFARRESVGVSTVPGLFRARDSPRILF